MKYVLILADGMADYPINELNGKTPLQYASTPNIDKLAQEAIIGKVSTVPPEFPPGSDVANLAVMGYNPDEYYSGRSPLEAVSMGVELGENDLAFRCNLVTLSKEPNYGNKTMLDYSAGEISSEESCQLIAALQEKLGNNYINFYPGISYRHLMVWRNGLDKQVFLTPPHDISDRVIGQYLPTGKDSQVLLDLMIKSEEILINHPVNQERVKAGKNPAVSAWFWGEGKKPMLTSFQTKYNLQGSVVAAVDLVKGLGICAGLNQVEVDGATGGVVTNFAGKAEAALEELKRGQDFVYVHIEAPDEAGHQGSLEHKIWAIEQIDEHVVGLFVSQLDSFDDIKIMLLPDHPTPLSTRTHSREPVPFMLYHKSNPVLNGVKEYNEIAADQGIFIDNGYRLMDFFIHGKLPNE